MCVGLDCIEHHTKTRKLLFPLIINFKRQCVNHSSQHFTAFRLAECFLDSTGQTNSDIMSTVMWLYYEMPICLDPPKWSINYYYHHYYYDYYYYCYYYCYYRVEIIRFNYNVKWMLYSQQLNLAVIVANIWVVVVWFHVKSRRICYGINSLYPNDSTWLQTSSLTPVYAWWAPSHYLNQLWHIANSTPVNKLGFNQIKRWNCVW